MRPRDEEVYGFSGNKWLRTLSRCSLIKIIFIFINDGQSDSWMKASLRTDQRPSKVTNKANTREQWENIQFEFQTNQLNKRSQQQKIEHNDNDQSGIYRDKKYTNNESQHSYYYHFNINTFIRAYVQSIYAPLL